MGEAHIGLRWRGPAVEDSQSTMSFASDAGDLIDCTWWWAGAPTT